MSAIRAEDNIFCFLQSVQKVHTKWANNTNQQGCVLFFSFSLTLSFFGPPLPFLRHYVAFKRQHAPIPLPACRSLSIIIQPSWPPPGHLTALLHTRFATADVHVVAPHRAAPHRVSLAITLSPGLMSRDMSGALGVSLPRLPQPTPLAFIRGAPRIDPSERRLRPIQWGSLLPAAERKRGEERRRQERERRSRSPAPRHNETPLGPGCGRRFAGRWVAHFSFSHSFTHPTAQLLLLFFLAQHHGQRHWGMLSIFSFLILSVSYIKVLLLFMQRISRFQLEKMDREKMWFVLYLLHFFIKSCKPNAHHLHARRKVWSWYKTQISCLYYLPPQFPSNRIILQFHRGK